MLRPIRCCHFLLAILVAIAPNLLAAITPEQGVTMQLSQLMKQEKMLNGPFTRTAVRSRFQSLLSSELALLANLSACRTPSREATCIHVLAYNQKVLTDLLKIPAPEVCLPGFKSSPAGCINEIPWYRDFSTDTGNLPENGRCENDEVCVYIQHDQRLAWTIDNANKGKKVTWQTAQSACNGLNYDGWMGWRLPTEDEMIAAFESNVLSSYKLDLFNDLSANFAEAIYWTSSSYDDKTRVVYFLMNGNSTDSLPVLQNRYICVNASARPAR